MNTFPVPFKIVATVLLTAIFVIVGVMNLGDRASWKDPTDGVFWEEKAWGLTAAQLAQGGSGDMAGIKIGDRLVSINGHPITNLGQYSDLLYQMGADTTAKYVLVSGTEMKALPVRIEAKVLLTAKDSLRTLLAFLHLGIGLFVIFKGGRQPRAFHFYWICLAAFIVYLYSWTPKLAPIDWLVYALSVLAFLMLPALFVHFCLRFPVDSAAGQSRAPLLYAPFALLVMLQVFWISGRLAFVGLPRTEAANALLDHIHLAYFSAGFLAGGMVLLKRRAEARNLTMRQQMKWVSFGTMAGIIPFSAIYVLPVILGVRASFIMESSQLFLGLIPLSFAYAIIHFRLLDVEVIVRRSVAYFLASSLLLAIYVVFVLLVGRSIQSLAPDTDFLLICLAALAIALPFAPLRNAIQVRLDRFFYKDHFDDRSSLLEFARTLGSEISLGPLSCRILERVAKTFGVDKAALFLNDGTHPGRFYPVEVIDVDLPTNGSKSYEEEDLVDDADTGSPLGSNPIHPLRQAGSYLAQKGLYYLQDLNLRGRLIGMIALGQLPQNSHFSSEDIELLAALSGYAAIALENAGLYRSVEMKAMELERLKIYTENIIESVHVAILAVDLSGRITSCNRAFEELYHVRRNQIVGTRAENLFAADILASMEKASGTRGWELRSAANIFKLFLENRRGDRLIVNLSLIPLLDSMDINSGCLIVMDDITAKVRLEEQLLQAEKLSSIGLLAAGFAHEVNTPITGISSYAQMLLKETPETDGRKQLLEKIEKQTFRAAEIVNGLLNFSRMNGSDFKDLDLNQLVRESLALLDHQLRRNNIQVQSALDESVPKVYGNAGKLQQVFVNLFLNARDAMPSGGNLRIETSMNESMVILDITDTGVGISEADIRRIYDPFFTTKGAGGGTGLGLSVTYGIIQEHGGLIFADSVPGQGTHFRVKLPTRQEMKK